MRTPRRLAREDSHRWSIKQPRSLRASTGGMATVGTLPVVGEASSATASTLALAWRTGGDEATAVRTKIKRIASVLALALFGSLAMSAPVHADDGAPLHFIRGTGTPHGATTSLDQQ